MEAIRILIVDDVAQVRRELRTLLSLLAAIEVVGEAEHGQSAVELAGTLRPDVIIMDVEMPIMDGLAATRIIKQQCPASRIVILSIHGEETTRATARLAGADAFVDKGAPLAALLQAIQLDAETTPASLRGASFATKQSPIEGETC